VFFPTLPLKNSDVKETPTGLQYKVLLEGDGESPGKTDKVKVHYVIYMLIKDIRFTMSQYLIMNY